MKRIALLIILFFTMVPAAQGGENPITRFKDETLSYFGPLTGTITGVEDDRVIMEAEEKYPVKPGMRMKVMREGAEFIHPVTKEPLGRSESTVGKVEVTDVLPDSFTGIIVEGEAKEGDRIRISGTKVKLLFCQDKNMDWRLADEYYRTLKETGRMEMIDTSLETGDPAVMLEEAKKLGAEAALLLTAEKSGDGSVIREQLFWVADGSKFFEAEAEIEASYSKELNIGEEFFTPRGKEAILVYDLPLGAKLVSTGDFDGDGKEEIILGTGRDISIYTPSVDLQFLWEVKGSLKDDNIWIDSIDLNGNGRDELVVTSMRHNGVISTIYELSGSEFKKLWEGGYFLRAIGPVLLAQSYSNSRGFAGDVFAMTWDGTYRTGEKIDLPSGINIYDFAFIPGSGDARLILAYDESGFLNLYQDGIKTWRSSSKTGGFTSTFKIKSEVSYLSGSEWSVKDRLVPINRDILAVERVPFVKMARGMGYKSSKIRYYRWNGLLMAEGVLIDDIIGSVLDYTVSGNRLIVLTSPFLGIKFKNILKGENPLGKMLLIYSL